MLKYNLFFFAAVSMLLYSCGDDSFSQVVTIDLPEHTPEPAFTLHILQGDTEITAIVSNSKGALDQESEYELPADAEVKLFKNGELILQLEQNPTNSRYEGILPEGISDQGGDVYQFTTKLTGFDLASAEQTMPPSPTIIEALFEAEGTIDSEGFRVDELTVDIKDADPSQMNYYGIELFQVFYNIDPSNGDTIDIFRNQIGLDSNDPLLEYSNDYGLIFSDEGFSGGEYQLRCYSYFSVGENANLEVDLYQLSKDAFLYSRSLDQYYNAIDNPFAEPVTVHDNVDGGYGVFTLVNRTVLPL